MPFSQSTQISSIMGFIEQLNPASILDVGTGMGQYGFLSRSNLEHVNLFEIEQGIGKQRPREQWRVKIDGIEGFEGYLTPVHQYCYNHIMIGNALDILPSIENQFYDLVLAIDILEHFQKQDGEDFLAEIKRVCRKACLVSTPKQFIPQEVEANPYENHLSLWSESELSDQGFKTFLPNDISWIAIHNKSL